MAVTVNIHQDEIDLYFRSPAGPVYQWAHDITEAVRNAAVRKAPRDTGLLASTIEMTVRTYGALQLKGTVGSRLDYATYFMTGTGIYGPKKRPIKPVTKKVLRFKPRGGVHPVRRGTGGTSPERRGPWVFAKQVKGMPKKPFLIEALEEVLPGRVRVFDL